MTLLILPSTILRRIDQSCCWIVIEILLVVFEGYETVVFGVDVHTFADRMFFKDFFPSFVDIVFRLFFSFLVSGRD